MVESWKKGLGGSGSPLGDKASMFGSGGYKTLPGLQSLSSLPGLSKQQQQLPKMRRSSSGAGLLGERQNDLSLGSSGLRAIRTARHLTNQLDQLAPSHLVEVRKALAILQTAGLHEVADVSGLHEATVEKIASLPSTNEAKEPEVMLAPALQTGLVFDFTQEELEDTEDVGAGLIGLRTLRSLRLRFCRCGITDVEGLGRGIRDLSALKELHIDFASCTGLAEIDELAKGIANLYGIDTLYINFQGCTALENVSVLAETITSLSKLKTLTLNFQECSSLGTDAAVALGSAIAKLPGLIDLDLNVCGSRVRRGVQRPTILEPGPLGITNYLRDRQPPVAPKQESGS